MTRETVGKSAYDLLIKTDHEQLSPIEYEREMHKEYEKEVIECIETHKKLLDGDFFVVVLRKRERAAENVFRTYFFARKSCPTPSYDQTVYKYHRKDDHLEFLWTIPDLETATVFKNEALSVVPAEQELLGFVLDYYSGELDKKAAILNNEPLIQQG